METFRKEDARNLWWVSQAAGKSDDGWREWSSLLLIQNQMAMATDGNRIHAAMISLKIPDGCYHVVKRTKTRVWLVIDKEFKISDFPVWDNIFPGHSDDNHRDKHLVTPEMAAFTLANAGVMLQLKFVKQLFADGWNYDWVDYDAFDYSDEECGSPIIFNAPGDRRIAALMPMRGFK